LSQNLHDSHWIANRPERFAIDSPEPMFLRDPFDQIAPILEATGIDPVGPAKRVGQRNEMTGRIAVVNAVCNTGCDEILVGKVISANWLVSTTQSRVGGSASTDSQDQELGRHSQVE
jgi:hypothetical protein